MKIRKNIHQNENTNRELLTGCKNHETHEFFPGLFQTYTFIEVKIIILRLGLSFYCWKNEKVKAPFNILGTT